MKHSLTIAYLSSRLDPKVEWFLVSLANQITSYLYPTKIIFVDGAMGHIKRDYDVPNEVQIVSPKPTIWQGKHRITKEDWWAKSNALNTAIILCKTEWIAFVDDRSVLMPGWLDCVNDAMNGNYAVCGHYEKHIGMKVHNGVITDPGLTVGVDTRTPKHAPVRTPDWYGGHGALPLEWCLAVNGFPEDLCDGLGSEDSCFGITLRNSGYPIMYDGRMQIIEDRTPTEIDGALKRADKGISPNDKSHAIIRAIIDKKTSQNSFDIRNMRERVLNGEPLDSIKPSASHFDWYDNTPISEME